jgi:hypothetical protein
MARPPSAQTNTAGPAFALFRAACFSRRLKEDLLYNCVGWAVGCVQGRSPAFMGGPARGQHSTPGAGKESAAERRIATVAQVDALAEAIGIRWRLMVCLGAYRPMRPEELAGLRRRDVDPDDMVIRVRVAEPERTNGKRAPGETKSGAGVRGVVLPAFLHKEVRQHLAWFAEKGPDAGATLKDTMVRAGQSSERAALIYQHSDEERQREVASGLDDLVRGEREKHHKGNSARHKEEPTGT